MKRFIFLVLACLVISASGPAIASASSSDSLISSARTHLGTPYRYGGTTTSGFDCSGYTQRVFRDAGISIPRTTGQQYAIGTSVAKNNLQVGDIVFFNTTGRGVSHNGIYIGSNNFIHSSSSRGVMVSSINDPHYWGSRYIGACRVNDFSAAPKAQVTPTPPKAVAKPKPDPYPTRTEVAVTLVEELGLTATNESLDFKDVSGKHPEAAAIAAVSEAGIFTGSNGSFMPDKKITRAQLAKVLVESFKLEGSSNISFGDVSDDHWAKEYISTLYYNEVTTGYENGNFGVDDNVTKVQLQKFIDRLN